MSFYKNFYSLISGCVVLCLLVIGILAVPANKQVSAFEPFSYNELRRNNSDGTVTSEFHGKYVNYLDEENNWKRINLSFDDNNGFHLTEAPYELHAGLTSTDDIRFVSTNRYDVYTKTIRDDLPMGKTRRFLGVASVEGVQTNDGVLYADALPHLNASLLLQPHEMEARYLVKWEEAPSCTGTVEIPFEETYDEGVPLMRSGEEISSEETELSDGYSVKVNDFRGIGTPTAHIWDSNGKRNKVTIVGKYEDGVFTGKKLIPCHFFSDVTYPVYTDDTSTFYPNADPETTTVDGHVENLDTNWNTVHDATSGTVANDAGTYFHISTGKDGDNFFIRKAAVLFDTSSLSSMIITNAEVSLYGYFLFGNGDNDGDDYFNIVSPANLASNTAVTTADFDVIGSSDSPTTVSTGKDYSSISTSGYNTWSITSLSAINNTGITKLGIREGHDILDSPYAGAASTQNSIGFYSAEQTGTSQDPKLVVTYTPTSNLSIQKTGDAQVGSGATAIYTLTATNNGPGSAAGVFMSDVIPSGFTFKSSESSADCSVVGSNVRCGNFNLANGTSTGRTIAFTAALGTCSISRTNTATVSGATVTDLVPGNNSGSIVTTITCPVAATYVRKSSDESVTSSTTLQNDDQLKLTLTANKKYAFNGAVFATSANAQPDIKIAFTTPSGATMDIGFLSAFGGQFDRAELLETSGGASGSIPIAANQNTIIQLMGTLQVGSTGGDITFQWSQNTSNANATTVKQGSYISVVEIE